MSDKPNDGGAAFPGEQGHTPEGSWNQTFDPGMTLRDWFAGQALAGIGVWSPGQVPMDISSRAQWAYEQADAMLKMREPKS